MIWEWKCEPVWCCLTAEQGVVEGELLGQVFDVSDPLVHGSGEMISVIQAAQDDAGEVDGLSEVAHQRALDAHHIPSAGTNQISLDFILGIKQQPNTDC